MKLALIFLAACGARTLYEGGSNYVTGAGAAAGVVFFGLSSGALSAVSVHKTGRVYDNKVAQGNDAPGAYGMRASSKRIFWREPAGTANWADATTLELQPMGAVQAIATWPLGAVWLSSAGDLLMLKDTDTEATNLGALAALAPMVDFPLLATNGEHVYFPTRTHVLRRFDVLAHALDPNYMVALDAPLLGLAADDDVWLAFDDGALDRDFAGSGVIGPARLSRVSLATGAIQLVTSTAASQGAKSNMWSVLDKDYVYWCELRGGAEHTRRAAKKDLAGSTELTDRGCPVGADSDHVYVASPSAIIAL